MKTSAIILNSYPQGHPSEQDVSLINIPLGSCYSDQILIRLLFLSVDPYMRNRLRPEGTKYISQLNIGEPLVSMSIGEVVESNAANFQKGDIVIGMLPWQKLSVVDANTVKLVRQTTMPVTTQLGILGYPGFTAYIGVCQIAKPVLGQTVFVSSAAGAVGSLAGQLAKLHGCYVVGCASTDEKVDCLLNNYHFDAAFNYRHYQNDYAAAIRKYCPQGIDIDFENVGGSLLEAVIESLNSHAMIVLCGAISQYNKQNPRQGPDNFHKLIPKKSKLVGYIVTDYDYMFDEF